MIHSKFISSDRQASEARRTITEIEHALSSEQVLASIVEGLPSVAISGVNKALKTERDELKYALDSYEKGKLGDVQQLKDIAGNDQGMALIVARISQGLSQKELGRKLGLKEQQIQRYESERYSSLSLANYRKFASLLGVQSKPEYASANDRSTLAKDISVDEARKVLKHAKANGWLSKDSDTEEGALAELKKNVADHLVKYGSPSLLRTGLNVLDLEDDWLLLVWKAQVSRRAEQEIKDAELTYRPMQVSWLSDLVKLSEQADGPKQAKELLRYHGVILIVERQIPGLKLDGAAFLINEVPVIGMTLRNDAIDNFWFTLLHELAHVILHYRTGLSTGFFDDVSNPSVDELEREANEFAANLLIPEEVWRRSPVRITSKITTINNFAKQLQIHPAIVFGRIRRERGDYSLFSSNIGRGRVREQFINEDSEFSYE